MIEGGPSSDKTRSALLLNEAPKGIYPVDKLSAESLGSGWTDSGGRKRAKNILPELNGKCLLVKELSTMLSGRPDKVREALGVLQAIYDRDYARLTGTLGKVGGRAAFSIVACVTPAAAREHSQYMRKIGARFLTYRVPPLTDEQRRRGMALIRESGQKPDARRAVKAELR